jgi:hypothetical protein
MPRSNLISRRLPVCRIGATPTVALLLCAAGCDSSATEFHFTQDSLRMTLPVAATPMTVVSTNLVRGAAWHVNRPIEVAFDADVDVASLAQGGASIVRLDQPQAPPALGEWVLGGPRTLRSFPACPTRSDLTDGGLAPGATYQLTLSGAGSTHPVRSTAGVPLGVSFRVVFQTVHGSGASVAWDPKPTPPGLVVRDIGSDGVTSYVEVGEHDPARVAFERDPATGAIDLAGGATLPLNLYSDPATRVRFVLRVDQALAPGRDNVSGDSVQVVWRDDGGGEHRLAAEVTLRSNCLHPGTTNARAQQWGAADEGGAELVVAPLGVLPRGRTLAVRLEDSLRDIAGQAGPHPGLRGLHAVVDEGPSADVFVESFDGLEWVDTDATAPEEHATLGAGFVIGNGTFPGRGGPNGDFDYVVLAGQTVLFDTTFEQVTGGPNGAPTGTQDVIGGRLFVRNLHVQAGATLLPVGPNPLRVFATGAVRIDGSIDASGSSNFGVATLNTTNIPEAGAAGRAGGGRGGTGSPNTSSSSPRGGAGFGAFQTNQRGGEGGEGSYSAGGIDRRRGAGGGGGRFARDVRYRWNGVDVPCQTLIGLDAEPGFPGGFGGVGAVSQSTRAEGGAVAPAVFSDADPRNDFVGAMVLESGGSTLFGELNALWAGAGGGGGGDASNTASFPLTPFNPGGDEKGAGGGAGGGSIAIVALGRITVGATGSIRADGGHGGGGENTIFFDRVGGGSGGGSGGMILLESAVAVQIDALAPQGSGFGQALPFYTDNPAELRHPERPISAIGGQGGAGRNDACGANSLGQREWRVDAIPLAAFEGRTDVPPLGSTPGNAAFLACNDGSPNDPDGTTPGAGGDGGPGLIQVHVPDTLANFQLPPSAGGDPTFSFAPPPAGWEDGDFVGRLEPRFAGLSSVTSTWIALGAAAWDPASRSLRPLEFVLPGIDARGYVQPASLAAGVVTTSTPVPDQRIRLSFDAARATSSGAVDMASSLSATLGGMTNDLGVLNAGPWDYIRFRLDFERPLNGVQAAFAAEALRLPFRF